MPTANQRRAVMGAGGRQEVVAALRMRVPTEIRQSFDQTKGYPSEGPRRKRNVCGPDYMGGQAEDGGELQR